MTIWQSVLVKVLIIQNVIPSFSFNKVSRHSGNRRKLLFLFQSGKSKNFIKDTSNVGKVKKFDRPETGVDPSVMRMDDQLRSLSSGDVSSGAPS